MLQCQRMIAVACCFVLIVGPCVGAEDQRATTAGAEKKPTAKSAARITISAETTFFAGPLTKDGYVDFRAALNARFSKDVTAKNNALVGLLDATGPNPLGTEFPDEFFARLGIKRLPKKGKYFTDLHEFTPKPLWDKALRDWGVAMSRPWKKKQFPMVAAWLQANKEPLAVAVKAVRRPRFYHPWFAAGDDNMDVLLLLQLPALQVFRELARKLQTRALLKLGSQDFDGAFDDVLAMHRLARHLGQSPTLTGAIHGIAINGMACHTGRVIAAQDKITAEKLKGFQRQLAGLPPCSDMARCIDQCERFLFLDVVQHLARKGADSHLLNSLDIEDQVPIGRMLKRLMAREMFTWDGVMRTSNQWFDRLVAGFQKETFKERDQAVLMVMAELGEAWNGLKRGEELPKPAGGDPMKNKGRGKLVERTIADLVAILTIPAARTYIYAEIRDRLQTEITLVAVALAIYKKEQGEYPARLTDIVPIYMKKLPKEWAGNDVFYKRIADGYVLTAPNLAGSEVTARVPLDF